MGNWKKRAGRKVLSLTLLMGLFAGGLWASANRGLVCRANLFLHYLEASEATKDLSVRERLVYSFILSTTRESRPFTVK